MRGVLVFVAVLAVAGPTAWFGGQPGGLPRVTVLPTADGPTYLVEDGAGRRVLIGGGATDAAVQAFAEHAPPWDRRVDLLVLPPPFAAHLAGATEIVRRAETRRVIELGGPSAKPPQHYDAWQLATLDRGNVPERLWGYAHIPLAGGASLELIAPNAPDGVPVRLPTRAPRAAASGTSARTKPTGPITAEANAAPGAYARLTNGDESVLLALGAPGDAVPGFAQLRAPSVLVAPAAPSLPDLATAVQPHALLALAGGADTDPVGLPTQTVITPRGSALTVTLKSDRIQVTGVPNPPAWVR